VAAEEMSLQLPQILATNALHASLSKLPAKHTGDYLATSHVYWFFSCTYQEAGEPAY